jgi:hypothetical protein
MEIARTAADADAEASRRTCEDGVIATFRCAQSPRRGFLLSRTVFYTTLQGRKSIGFAALPLRTRQSLSSGGNAT